MYDDSLQHLQSHVSGSELEDGGDAMSGLWGALNKIMGSPSPTSTPQQNPCGNSAACHVINSVREMNKLDKFELGEAALADGRSVYHKVHDETYTTR